MTSIIRISASPAIENISGASGGLLSYDISLSEPSTDAISISYRLYSGSGLHEIDVPLQSGILTIPPGDESFSYQFRSRPDSRLETDESFVVEFFNPSGGEFEDNAQSLRVTNFIEDDDGTGNDRSLFVSSPTFVEGDSGTTNAVFTVSISEAYGSTTSFDYRTENGSARSGSDYSARSGEVIFAPGVTSMEMEVPVSGDTSVETNETFRLVVDTDDTIADGGTTAVGEATIRDDDTGGSLPTLSFDVTGGPENISGASGGLISVTAYLSEPSFDSVSFSLRTQSDWSDREIDFPFRADTVTFNPGETVKLYSLRANPGSGDEVDEFVAFQFFGPTGAVFANNATIVRKTASILDDDGTGSNLALNVSSPVLIEGDSGTQRAIFEITLSRPSTETLTFDYTTQDAGAQAGEDYTAEAGTITFDPGQTTATVDIIVSGDGASEPTEALQLVVTPTSALADGGIGAVGEAIIVDDDSGSSLPTLSLLPGVTLPTTAPENISGASGGLISFGLVLSEPSTDAVTVGYRTLAGTAQSQIDFPRLADTVTFSPGQTFTTVNLRARPDSADEDDEAFTIEFFDVDGAVFEGGVAILRDTAFIRDDDQVGLDRSIQVSSPVLIEGDDGTQSARFEVTLSRPFDETLEFDFTTQDVSAEAGTDYTETSGTLTFVPGQAYTVVDVPVSGDTDVEVSEFFQLVVTPTNVIGDSGAGSVGRATLIDDDGEDALPTLSITALPGRENVSGAAGAVIDFVVTLSEASNDAITVQYQSVGRTAVPGTDFPVFADTLTFSPGQTSLTISPRASPDSVDETDESFAVELFDPVSAVLAGGVEVLQEAAFILDDDGVGLNRAIHVSDATLREPEDGTTSVAVFDITLSRPFGEVTEVGYTTVNGSATAGSDFVAQSGTLTFQPGQTEAAVLIEILSDADGEEGTENFSLSLNSVPNSITGAPEGLNGVVTLLDGEAPPPTNVDPTGEPVITGDARVNQTVGTNTSSIEDENGLGDFAYQWLLDDDPISGATGDNYTVQQSDLNGELSVEVSFTDGIGSEESLTSDPVEVRVASGTGGSDEINGASGDDNIAGGDGNDTLNGEDGNDTLAGGAGADSIDGGEGDDNIGGGLGGDFILGSNGNDTIGAGQGDDTVDAGDGSDVVAGGAGNDMLTGGAGRDTIGASFGNDTVAGDSGDDDLGGGTGRDQILAGSGDDRAGGGEGDDTVNGGTGDDFLAGGGRNDVVIGGTGNDTINGGDGDDTMTGGDGSDEFVYNFFKDGDADVVTDYEVGIDNFRMFGVENAPGTGLQGRIDALNITDVAGGAQMNYQGHTIFLQGVSAADLTKDDFDFL